MTELRVVTKTVTSEEVVQAVEMVETITEYLEMVGMCLMAAALAGNSDMVIPCVEKIHAFAELVETEEEEV